MIIFSQTTEAFIKRIYPMMTSIISNEMGLIFKRSRIHYKGYLYPIGLSIFQSKNQLGNFDPHNFKIGLNERLMWQSKESIIKNILRHELAHYMTFLLHRDAFASLAPHGDEFKEVCRNLCWDENISCATLDIEDANDQLEGDLVTERLISKIKKLLELASSSNKYESELAMIKANQLILQHNLDLLSTGLNSSSEEVTYLKRILHSKKNSAKLNAIYEALSSFHVALCFCHGIDGVYLEAIGPRSSVEVAEYVGQFLDLELDLLWEKAKNENSHFKGIRVKNAFFKGIGQAMAAKNKIAQSTFATDKDLVILKNNLKFHTERAYKNLRTTYITTSSNFSSAADYEALRLGKKVGEKIQVRQPLETSHLKNRLLLT